MAWINEIFRNGTLKDNGVYSFVKEGDNYIMKSLWNDSIPIGVKSKGICSPYNWFDYLRQQSSIVNSSLRQGLKEQNLVLLNDGEYEHNTSDDFIHFQGYSAQNFTIETGNVIGFIGNGEYGINISSRFGDNFLKYIIASADGFLELEDLGGISNRNSFEWLVLYLWKIKLKKAIRLGIPKAYVTKTEDLTKVRGNIDAINYFQNGHTGKYRCQYREHSYSTLGNQLITTVFRKYKHHSFLKDEILLRNSFETAVQGAKPSYLELLSTPHYNNPYYNSYNDIIDLSKKLLKEEMADFGALSELNAYLFDVSMLFEYFVRKTLSSFDLHDKFDNRHQIPTASTSYSRKLEPDITFEHNNKLYVYDVKYKSFDFRYGVNREDLFQLHTYIGQYGNMGGIGGCGFIYPLKEELWDKYVSYTNGVVSQQLNFYGHKLKFNVFFIKVPEDNAENFSEAFSLNCKSFLESFYKKLRSEEHTSELQSR
jgi:5-methylcytosine-specific restriction endonuclease McrBC regulatory subunit McrC